VAALKQLNLAVPEGCIFGFLGRNGAGKTTTIRMLTGLAHPTQGSAWVAGVETTNGDDSAREHFGYLPQEPAFYNWMTATEFLVYCAEIYDIPQKERKARVAEILDRVGMKDAAKRKIAGFSGGMRQRLGIAQAMIHNPPVLFLDEPTSALDPAGRYEVLDMIESLRGQVTVFLSTHILTDVERICDKVAVIHKGELLLVSDRQALMEQYATNAAEIELDSTSLGQMEEIKLRLEQESWVARVTADQNVLQVMVEDMLFARQNLLPIVAANCPVVNRFEWVRPSLEEIFLKVSE
jgi:ABC-2 type transport system ATP-binding protein